MATRTPPTARGRAPAPPPTRNERRGTFRAPLVVLTAWLVVMAGANLGTPLYAVYAQRFGFSSLVLTSIFATYAFVLVPALIVFGTLSDRFGRRPVMLAALAVACLGLIGFAFARNIAWLYGARALQGLAVGMISGAATAALVELDPDGDRRRAALFAGLAQAVGSSAGPLLAGALAQWAPAPLRLSFGVGLVLTVVTAALLAMLPEPAGVAGREWRLQRPNVPRAIRRGFARVSSTAATAWASAALFLSIVPSYAGGLLGSRNLALLAAIAAVALVSSAATQVVASRRSSPRRARVRRSQMVGLIILATGLVALVLAAPLHSLALLVVGSAAAGVGHGIAFLNAQQELNDLAPDERRGEVTAAFVACIYFLVASSVIAVGLLDLTFSLSVAVGIVSSGLIAAALATALWQAADRDR